MDADYREMMRDIPKEEFDEAYQSAEGRSRIFAHAKFRAENFLDHVDCLVLSGNIAMIDPELFHQERFESQTYDFSRTIAELALVHVATQRGMPIMGICGGHQVVAVYGGGTLKDLNAGELNKQRFMNYESILFHVDSLLKAIISQHLNAEPSLELEHKFFGAHNQVVEELAQGFVAKAVGSDGHNIEAAESQHGSPVITTQFHPEVTVHGLPNVPFLYKKHGADREVSLKIFEFFAKAGEAYKNKKNLVSEIKSKSCPRESSFSKDKQDNINLNTGKTNVKKQINSSKKTTGLVKIIASNILKLIDKIKLFFIAVISYRLTTKKINQVKRRKRLIAKGGSKNIRAHKKSGTKESTVKIIETQMKHGQPLSKKNAEQARDLEQENISPLHIMGNTPARLWSANKPGEGVLDNQDITSQSNTHP
ncbi:gamma-glutamyl-gamma-aminobutyrate hydrolase family protein [Legionella worsleiensis]|uniref:gamma-glutamyl-gamma-aminobutyrate hydrolase family protein n=1 Tax=Legionella worsleiensis TaxID=45076 RepID=UPI001EE6E993|nr:gamma-glutamyl-gamma-aminobutyrate hydrolase family protein [Legionella worsleiensis]